MRLRNTCVLAVVAAMLAAGGCVRRGSGAAAAPLPGVPARDTALPSPPAPVSSGERAVLPPVPLVDGPLALRVVHPPAGALISARDSTFIFGSTGSGFASLTINGIPVPVHPNGAFIGFLPVPSRDQARYEIVAARGGDTVRLAHPVAILPPRPVLSLSGRLVVDSASLTGTRGLALRDDETVRISLRAPANARLMVIGGGEPRMLVPGGGSMAATGGAGTPAPDRASSSVPQPPSAPRPGWDPARWATDIPVSELRSGATLMVVRDRDTVAFALPPVEDPYFGGARIALLGATPAPAVSDTDQVVIARPTPAGTYKWLLSAGTPVQVTGRSGDFTRIRMDSALESWVPTADVTLLPTGAPAPRPVAGNIRVIPRDHWVDVMIQTGERTPFLVEQDDGALVLTLYGARSAVDNIVFVASDSLVRTVFATQELSDRVRITMRLSLPVHGYLAFWEGSTFVLRLRRPPEVDRRSPLRGRTIVVDAGHPPAGATGPTGLYEAVPALAVARSLESILTSRGATVVMTRTTDAPLALAERPIIARRANGDAFVSIHLNAYPDGVNPFLNNGTGTYYFQPHSEPLARMVQEGMLRRMGLRDNGVFYNTFAVTRISWMPSVLCEGAFLMIPEQEAALRSPVFQEAYARGVADGLEAYFRALGERVEAARR